MWDAIAATQCVYLNGYANMGELMLGLTAYMIDGDRRTQTRVAIAT